MPTILSYIFPLSAISILAIGYILVIKSTSVDNQTVHVGNDTNTHVVHLINESQKTTCCDNPPSNVNRLCTAAWPTLALEPNSS